MKRLKKIAVCLLAITLLCSSQLTYVSATAAAEEEGVMPLSSDLPIIFSKTAGSYTVTVTIKFNYADGTSVAYKGIGYKVKPETASAEDVYIVGNVNVYSANDYLYATATIHTPDGNLVFTAWCDIYGQNGHN